MAYPTPINLQNLTAENIHFYIGVDTILIYAQTQTAPNLLAAGKGGFLVN